MSKSNNLKTGLIYSCRLEGKDYQYYFFHNTGYYLSRREIYLPGVRDDKDLTEKQLIEALKTHTSLVGRDGFKASQVLKDRFPEFEKDKKR
jgi:hypothetical protein